MVGVIMKFPSVLVYHAVVSSVDPSGGGLVSIGVDLPDYLDDVGVLGFIRDRQIHQEIPQTIPQEIPQQQPQTQ